MVNKTVRNRVLVIIDTSKELNVDAYSIKYKKNKFFFKNESKERH